MMLAQTGIEAVPSGILKWILVTGFALVLIGTAVIGAWSSVRKKGITVEPQPMLVEKTPKRFSLDLCKRTHADIDRRLDGHDAEINSLWNTMRSEDTALRNEISRNQIKIANSLGRIEGRLGIDQLET